MKRYLISPEKKQYRANLHCHSVLSDGHLTPAELRDLYKAHGYEILAITDHERPHCHQDLCEPDFLMITGYEGYLRPDPLCRWNMYAPEVHLNLFARDPMNTTMICFNEAFCKYAARDHALDCAFECHVEEEFSAFVGTIKYAMTFTRLVLELVFTLDIDGCLFLACDKAFRRVLATDGIGFTLEVPKAQVAADFAARSRYVE